MYTKRETTYASAGHILLRGGVAAYQGNGSGYIEVEAIADDLRVRNGMATWGGGLCALSLRGCKTYGDVKQRLVKLRYSNDDQIAIMLNDDKIELKRMDDWRSWATSIAKIICRRAGILY